MRLVVKFGGTSVRTPARVRMAARNLMALRARGDEVLVVVSAMGDTTNRLMKLGRKTHPEATMDQHFLRLLATGETASANLLAMALQAEGGRSEAFGFDHPEFPLVAAPGQATHQRLSAGKVNDPVEVRLDTKACQDRFRRVVEPLIQDGVIPVIPGFFVLDRARNLVTLGRGGSDVSAFLVGRFARADEVIIVTDVKGVLTADPRLIANPTLVPEIDAALMSAVAQRGAQVLHPNALRYKPETVTARVVHYRDLGRLAEGTRITGVARTSLTVHPEPLTLLLLFGKGISARMGLLGRLGRFVESQGMAIHASTSSDTVVGLYLPEAAGKTLAEALHREFIEEGKDFDEMVVVPAVAEVRLSNPAFVNAHGVIRVIADTLFRGGINIVEMVTSHADILVYCRWDDGEKVRKALAERLGVERGGE